jgi:hypothetical protein
MIADMDHVSRSGDCIPGRRSQKKEFLPSGCDA